MHDLRVQTITQYAKKQNITTHFVWCLCGWWSREVSAVTATTYRSFFDHLGEVDELERQARTYVVNNTP